jgi:deoxyribonuclease-4
LERFLEAPRIVRMIKAGVHVSISRSIDRAVDRARDVGCDTFQIFSRNPRGWAFKELLEEDVSAFRYKLKKSAIGPAIAHMPYLPNLASPKHEIYVRSAKTLEAELERCGILGVSYLVTHLGSHLGEGKEGGMRRIIAAVKRALYTVDNQTTILLETTARSKNSIGGSFEDLREILDSVNNPRLGICLDTCHIFVAGYEVRTAEGLAETMEQFKEDVGLRYLKLVHLNDSRGCLGSGLDRHQHIGLGEIGLAGFRTILQHRDIRSLPLILETPVDENRGDRENLQLVRALAE